MVPLYLNDPNGLKEPKLSGIQVVNPQELFEASRRFLCTNLIQADPLITFFGQNQGTHAANVATLVEQINPSIKTAIVSNHEIRWLKEMFEIPGYQPDSTHSNYHPNEPVHSPTFAVRLADFPSFADTIRTTEGPAIFYVSHISRLTGETQDIQELCRLVRAQHPDSVLMIDGAQALGVTEPVDVNGSSDVYLGMSSKFLGAEPNLGFAFFAQDFAKKYHIQEHYPLFNPKAYDKDLFSLWESLQNPLYQSDYHSYIVGLKAYAEQKMREHAPSLLYVPPKQSPGFLTLDFGSKGGAEQFVAYAAEHGVIISDNANDAWSIIPAPKPLVRVGISVRTTAADIDKLIDLVQAKERTP